MIMALRSRLRCHTLFCLAVIANAAVGCRRTEPPAAQVTTAPSEAGKADKTVPPVWGALTPGPHAVGYRQLIIHDTARQYPSPLAPSAERPILLNLWYPAAPDSGRAMNVDDYLQVRAAELTPADRCFADLLERHVRSGFAQETLGREPQFLDQKLLARLPPILSQPVLARREAAPLVATHPLVLAHPGLGGAFADNFVLYEYLASHGYVVIASAFQSAAATELHIEWQPATSIPDLDVIARWARENLRSRAVAVMGHSYGAQAALIYAMEGRPIDAVISLDSTLNYGDPKTLWYKTWQRQSSWLDRAASITVPTLLISTDAETNTTFFDELLASDRRSLQLPFLMHNEFESHGVIQARFAYDLRDKDADGTAAQVGAGYELLVRATLAFLDGTLRKDERALVRLDSELPAALAGAKLVHIAHPRGLEAAVVLRQIRDHGIAAAGASCAATPGCNESEVFAEAGAQLLAAGEAESALKVLTWLTERQPDAYHAASARADALTALHRDAEALSAYQRALTLLPKDTHYPLAQHPSLAAELQRHMRLVGELLAKGR